MEPDDLGQLKTQEWQSIQDLVTRFEAASQKTAVAPLESFLPPAGSPLRQISLLELIKSDLELRWRRGKGLTIEIYLDRFPELKALPSLWPKLLFEEFRVRQQYADKPGLGGYQQRFPEQFPALEDLVKQNAQAATQLGTRGEGRGAREDESAASEESSVGLTSGPLTPLLSPLAPRPSPLESATNASQIVGGGYRQIKRIGSGSYGEVWRAEAPGGVAVALKIIFRPLDHEEAQRELQALELIKKLRHPYLAQTQAFWSQSDRLYIVMELADCSLRDRFKQCQKEALPGIPAPELVGYFTEAAEALDYLHACDVLHRDIKPDNLLLVQPEGQRRDGKASCASGVRPHLKVGDFGLVRIWESQRLGASGAGTPAYMPPEAWNGKLSRHGDQYSLAATYAELRAGRSVFSGKNMYDLMVECLTREPDLSGLEDAERQVLRKALDKDPDKRFGTCLEFVHELAKAVTPAVAARSGDRATTAAVGGFDPSALGTLRANELDTLGMGSAPSWRSDTERGANRSTAVAAPRRLMLLAVLALLVCVPAGLFAYMMWFRDENATRLPAVFEPPGEGWQHVADAKVVTDANDRRFYDKFDLLRDGCRFRFVLVPLRPQDTTDASKIPSFYIMDNKVTVAQFRAFARSIKLQSDLWDKPDSVGGDYPQDNDPVFNVTVDEAYQFARWLGGNLPTVHEWDKAAGRFETNRGEGPYTASWNKADADQIAVARGASGPMPCGAAKADISLFGCHDMAGNGREWTRDLDSGGRTVPLGNPDPTTDYVLVRGHTYRGTWGPLTFKELDAAEQAGRQDTGFYVSPESDIGFRVVIEP